MLLSWEGKGKPTITTIYSLWHNIPSQRHTHTRPQMCTLNIHAHTFIYTRPQMCTFNIHAHTFIYATQKWIRTDTLTHTHSTYTHTHTHTQSYIHPTGEENHIRVATQWLRKPTIIHMRFIDTTFRLQPGSPRQVWRGRGGRGYIGKYRRHTAGRGGGKRGGRRGSGEEGGEGGTQWDRSGQTAGEVRGGQAGTQVMSGQAVWGVSGKGVQWKECFVQQIWPCQ